MGAGLPVLHGLLGSYRGLARATPIVLLTLFAIACAPLETPGPPLPAWSLPEVVNDDGRGVTQFDPALTVDAAGTLHAAWMDFRDGAGVFGLYHARRPAGSAAWEANTRVSDMIGPVCRDDADIAVDRGGNVHVVWSDYRRVDPDIYASTLVAGAGSWSEPRRVNDDATATIQWSPAIAADGRGGVWVVWADYRDGQSDIYAAYRDSAGVWSPSERVNDVADGIQERPAVVVAPGGDAFVAWADQGRDAGDIHVARRAAGAAGWGKSRRLNGDGDQAPARQSDPALGVDAAGVVTAAWHDEREGGGAIRAARLAPAADGSYADVWGEDVLVSAADAEAGAGGAGPAERPAVGGGAGGATWVAWYEAGGGGGGGGTGGGGSEGAGAGRMMGADWNGERWRAPQRIDDSVVAASGRNPAVAVDAAGRGHVIWYAEDRDRQKEVFHAIGEEAPAGEWVDLTGRLEYRAGEIGCPDHGFVVVACDGRVSPIATGGGSVADGGPGADGSDPDALDALLGQPVKVHGRRIEGGCPQVIDAVVTAADPLPCADPNGMVAGNLRVPPLASPAGARVWLDAQGGGQPGGRFGAVGPDGRYFFGDVAPGRYRLSAEARCGLTASTEGATAIDVAAGRLARVPEGRVLLGDATGDCAIDRRDLEAVTAAYDSAAPFDPPCADVSGDGAVTLQDVVAVAVNQGAVCGARWTAGAEAAEAEDPAVRSQIPVGRSEARLGVDNLADAGTVLSSTSSEMSPEIVVPLAIQSAHDLYAFALTLQYDPAAHSIVDADPEAAGVQAADLSMLPEGAWVVVNRADPVAGEAQVAVTLVAPAAPLAGDLTLARLRFAATGQPGHLPRVTGLAFRDAGGASLDVGLAVEGLVTRTAYHLWVPWVGW